MTKERRKIDFIFKILRNGVILAGLYFVSIWAGNDLSYSVIKPAIIFLVTYILTEMAHYYKIAPIRKTKKITTLIL